MNRKELSQNHWKYYLMLEKRFVESSNGVQGVQTRLKRKDRFESK